MQPDGSSPRRHHAALLLTLAVTACSSTPTDNESARTPEGAGPQLALEYDPTSGAERTAADADRPETSPTPSLVEVTRVGSGPEESADGDPTGIGRVARDLVVVRPIGADSAAGTSATTKSVAETAAAKSRTGTLESQLREEQRDVVGRIGVLVEMQRPLDDFERASIQDELIQLIALHDLKVGGGGEYRDIVIRAADRLVKPSRRVRFRLAAFFEDIGISDRADKLFPTSDSEEDPTTSRPEDDKSFKIVSMEPQMILRKGKEVDFDSEDVRYGDDVRLYATLEGLTARSVPEGYRYKFSVEAFLYDEQDKYISYQPLVKNQIETSPEPLDPTAVDISYVIPLIVSAGKTYRLELKVKDEFSDDQDIKSIALRVRKSLSP